MNRCRNGSRCAGADYLAPGDRIAVEVGAPDTFCIACMDRTAGRIRGLPDQYTQLQLLLHITHHSPSEGHHPTPSSTVLLNLHIDALCADIAYLLELCGEIAADLAHLDDPPRFDLYAAAELVAQHLHRLADLEPWPVFFWARSGTWRRLAEAAGTALIDRLDRLAQLASTALGATRARTRRDLPCSRCHAKTVGRWAGSDYYDCSSCGARWHLNDIARQDRILIELHKRGKLKVP